MDTMAQMLANYGLLDPVGLMAKLANIFAQLGLFDAFRWLAFGVFLALVGYRLLVATAQLRAQAFLSLLLRSLIVGVLIWASPYLQMATLNLYNTAWSAGLELGGHLFDYNAALTQNYSFIVTSATFLAGASAAVLVGKAAANAGEKSLEELAKREGATTALGNATGEAAAKSVSKALDYFNFFAILLLPLMLMFAVISVTSGITVLVGTMFLPVLLTFLVLNGPAVTSYFLNPFYRAVAGSYLLALFVPIVFGAGAFVALGIPMMNFSQDWDQTLTKLKQTPWFELGTILSLVGSLLWVVVRTAIQVLVGVILGYFIVNKAAETTLHFVGAVGGLVRSYAEAVWTGRIGAATARTILAHADHTIYGRAKNTAVTAAVGGYRLGSWTKTATKATATTLGQDLQAKGMLGVPPPEPNAYDLQTRTPLYVREWNRDSAYDRVLQWFDRKIRRTEPPDHRRIPLDKS